MWELGWLGGFLSWYLITQKLHGDLKPKLTQMHPCFYKLIGRFQSMLVP